MRYAYRTTRFLLAAVGVVALLGSCDDLTGDNDGGPEGDGPVQPDSGPPPPNLVSYQAAGETAQANFENGTEEFLVVPYSVSDQEAAAIDFEIKLTAGAAAGDGGVSSKSFKIRQPARPPLKVRNPALWARWQQRLAVERWTRSLAEKAAKAKMSRPKGGLGTTIAGETCVLSSECVDGEVCHAGVCAATVQLNVQEFASTDQTIDVEVKKKGTTAAILVDSADTVDSADIDAMLEQFESLIYPRDVALFGNPKLEASGDTLSSDRNADGLVWLVFTSKVADRNAVGFFVATDFEDAGNSNKADILYIDSGITELDKAYATIAHEFQHLLGFGSKVYKAKVAGGQGTLEALWLDEGQSHFAEDACGYGGENTTVLDESVFPSFSDTSVFGATDSLEMRGMAFTFVRYLFEQKGGASYESDGTITDNGGAAVLQGFHNTDKLGTEAVTTVYGDYKAAFDGWITAIALDGRGVTTYAPYVFQDLITDPKTSNQIGIKIRGPRNDATGASVDLQGPLEEDLTADVQDVVASSTGKLFLLKGQTGTVDVSVTSADTSIRFALIKLK